MFLFQRDSSESNDKTRKANYKTNDASRLSLDVVIRKIPVIKANFFFQDFEWELFGQPLPVKQKNAYLHMVIEYTIMRRDPSIKAGILDLKRKGHKTESAFCKVLEIPGDPYDALIEYGKVEGII
nr:DUF4269 domain-containing protein [Radiobacillus kanasensis]